MKANPMTPFSKTEPSMQNGTSIAGYVISSPQLESIPIDHAIPSLDQPELFRNVVKKNSAECLSGEQTHRTVKIAIKAQT
ncbi:uncharacterized protein ANIA_11602 [Aspergillus nidulans FGSC A4]|uniref:Uncharacterized protein n=1 Tax=Emericella nidulans (strain FGSC A4 / ATCC 38163 / CBS 112.46 / NRRL 194 / M139) TaxID=227321 RepID=C8VE53_EMENI|nr:hypothetical protein [Aspergillus nidulans FGSC A4]CBF80380.1 TPA: hypothetical protein ANIA_11602 [Aspergillus nidulans FGSC A4]